MFSNPAENFATERFTAEPGQYRAKIISIKCRAYEKDGELESYILSYTFRLQDGEFAGNVLQSYDCWLGTPDAPRQDGINNMMRPVLAVCGITPGERGADETFKNSFGHLDLSFDPASNAWGSGWDSIRDQELDVIVSKNLGKDGNTYQKFNRFAPVGG